MSSVPILAIVLALLAEGPLEASAPPTSEPRSTLTVGLFQGASLLGFDGEFLMTDRLGAQLGAGFIGFDGGFTYHYRPGIRSRHLYLGYYHLGVPGTTSTLQLVGMSHVWRSRKPFTAQLGLALPVARQGRFREDLSSNTIIILGSIGLCRTLEAEPETPPPTP